MGQDQVLDMPEIVVNNAHYARDVGQGNVDKCQCRYYGGGPPYQPSDSEYIKILFRNKIDFDKTKSGRFIMCNILVYLLAFLALLELF